MGPGGWWAAFGAAACPRSRAGKAEYQSTFSRREAWLAVGPPPSQCHPVSDIGKLHTAAGMSRRRLTCRPRLPCDLMPSCMCLFILLRQLTTILVLSKPIACKWPLVWP
jgi:hypothetical protein